MQSTVLILPGINDSGPAHWQTLWQQSDSSFIRVQQRDWDNPLRDEWVQALEKAVASAGTNTILVAHSLGCLLVAHWATQTKHKIKGALLVAVPSPDSAAFPAEALSFAPLPLKPLAFRTTLVASSDDPYCELSVAQSIATSWGSRFVNMGAYGHINGQSGLENWQAGRALLRELAS